MVILAFRCHGECVGVSCVHSAAGRTDADSYSFDGAARADGDRHADSPVDWGANAYWKARAQGYDPNQ